MTVLDESTVSGVRDSLLEYRDNIGEIANNLNSDSYISSAEGYISDAHDNNSDISSFLNGIVFSPTFTSDDIEKLDGTYNTFYNDLQTSNNINSDLQKIVSKYETTEVKLKSSQKSNTYSTLLVWIVIFMFVAFALFLSVIEDKKDMNILSKMLLCLGSLVGFFYVAKNLKVYIERNIQ
jgi:hypothetical protein